MHHFDALYHNEAIWKALPHYGKAEKYSSKQFTFWNKRSCSFVMAQIFTWSIFIATDI